MFTNSWDFTLASKDDVINALMPTFLEQEKDISFRVYPGMDKKQVLEILEECTREFIGYLMEALEKHLKETSGEVINLQLSYVCDTSCSQCWTIQGTHNGELLTVHYTSDWYTEDAVQVTVGQEVRGNLSGWAS